MHTQKALTMVCPGWVTSKCLWHASWYWLLFASDLISEESALLSFREASRAARDSSFKCLRCMS